MRNLTILLAILLLYSCANDDENKNIKVATGDDKTIQEHYLDSQAHTQNDISECTALEFLKLSNKNTEASFFHQLDSVRILQSSKNDEGSSIFVDLNSKLLTKFLKDLDTTQLVKTGNFTKEYYFNIAPQKFHDSKNCKDRISLDFDKQTCSFKIVVYNEFFAEWCQESNVIYTFKIKAEKICNFKRDVAG